MKIVISAIQNYTKVFVYSLVASIILYYLYTFDIYEASIFLFEQLLIFTLINKVRYCDSTKDVLSLWQDSIEFEYNAICLDIVLDYLFQMLHADTANICFLMTFYWIFL